MKNFLNQLKEKFLLLGYKIGLLNAGAMDEESDMPYNFIWGLLSYDDLSGAEEANIYTMNDLDILYDKRKKKYILSIETIYSFFDGKQGEINYLHSLLNNFTAWMNEHGYDTNFGLIMYEVFTDLVEHGIESESIEMLYAKFKLLVEGYALYFKQEKE